MKKIALLLMILFLITGCQYQLSENEIIYKGYVEELKELKNGADVSKIVDLDIKLDKLTEDEITYSVVIDNPKVKMRKVEAIVYHDQKTEDVFPSIGVFDKKLSLIPNLKKNNGDQVKGIALVGYIKSKKEVSDLHPTIKVLILYNNEDNERQKISYIKKL